jgi:hypothetical protein
MRQARVTLLALAIAALLCSAGCAKHQWQDETHNPAFGNFGAVVGTWKAKVPLRLVQEKNDSDSDLALVLGDFPMYPDMEDLGILPVGTEVRIEHLQFLDTYESSTSIKATGSLTAGPYQDRPLLLNGLLFAKDWMATVQLDHGDPNAANKDWTVNADALEK